MAALTTGTEYGGSAMVSLTQSQTTCTPPRTRSRPAFEKILIGPVMVFGEMITGGHYLEVLRLGKQMTIGKMSAPSYLSLHKTLVSESGGLVGAFYRGFLPWGLLQCAKGIPVLFVQHESMYLLQTRAGWSPKTAEKVSGFLGGAAQAVFVNPFQKLKVTVVASQEMNALSPLQASRSVVREFGFLSLYDGLLPHVTRRSLDWGLRFGVSSEVKHFIMSHKRQRGQSESLSIPELMVCGLLGGAASASTHPIDNVITNSLKPLPPGESRDLISVVRRMYRESGIRAFTRGWDIKVIDNAYHMVWMYGIGTIVYDHMAKAFQDV